MDEQMLSEGEIKRVFMKLELVYGKRFRENWPDIPMLAVMADWAQELGAFTGDAEALGYALRHLPPTFPPTVLEFKELCQSAVSEREREERAAATLAQLEAPREPPSAAQRARIHALCAQVYERFGHARRTQAAQKRGAA